MEFFTNLNYGVNKPVKLENKVKIVRSNVPTSELSKKKYGGRGATLQE